jgi:hypothetical protein
MDIEVLRSFDPLLADECFLGFQQRHRNSDWVNNAVMGAQPGNRFVKRCLEAMLDTFERSHAILRGPQCTTAVLMQMGLCRYGDQILQAVRLYRSDYFYPYPWWANYHPVRVQPYAYTIHHWQRTSYDMHKFPLSLKLRAWLYDRASNGLARRATRAGS